MNGKPPQNKRKDIAMKYVHFFCITYFVFTIIGCGKKHHEQVEINVSDSLKKAIEEAAPKKQRYTATIDFYIYAVNNEEAVKHAKMVADERRDKYDDQTVVQAVHSTPFGTMSATEIYKA